MPGRANDSREVRGSVREEVKELFLRKYIKPYSVLVSRGARVVE